MLSINEAILCSLSLRPNMTLTAQRLQYCTFLIEVGLFGDPTSIPTGYGFKAGPDGPVSDQVYQACFGLEVHQKIGSLLGHVAATYIALEDGYAEGLATLRGLSSVRRNGIIETVTHVKTHPMEEIAQWLKQAYPEFCNAPQTEETQDGLW